MAVGSPRVSLRAWSGEIGFRSTEAAVVNGKGGRIVARGGLGRPRIFQERILLALDPFRFFAQLGAGRVGDV